jgi:hypothetical protein
MIDNDGEENILVKRKNERKEIKYLIKFFQFELIYF